MLPDDTGLPAVYNLLTSRSENQKAEVYFQSEDLKVLQDLQKPQGVSFHFVDLNYENAEDSLLMIGKALPITDDCTIWAAGEPNTMRSLRDYFLKDINLNPQELRIFGYWNNGTSSTEIDRVCLKHYEGLRAQGAGLAEVDDFDIPHNGLEVERGLLLALVLRF